jgi:hypothetical protein
MTAESNGLSPDKKSKEYRKFVWPRAILAIVIAILLLWIFIFIVNHLLSPDQPSHTEKESAELIEQAKSYNQTDGHSKQVPDTEIQEHKEHAAAPEPPPDLAKGVYFMNQLIKPLEYELNERFWGWRPNDILNFTDNVNEMQLGILEVTRRATVYLTERISRSGSAEALDPNLENAMNWFMINPESYWFPSPESKYKDALNELGQYRDRLEKGQENFYVRSDNLIPLLRAFEELLGSCDDNLVKQYEKDGNPVSTFHADNYFYYAKGVSMAMEAILRGVAHDFKQTISVRGGEDIMEHALHACHLAAEMKPWICVTEGDLNGIFANHRANMATHTSHARFYISLLAETLST